MATPGGEPLALAVLTGLSRLELLWLQVQIPPLTCITFGLAGHFASFSSKATGFGRSLPLSLNPLAVATLQASAKGRAKRSLLSTAEAILFMSKRGKAEEDVKQEPNGSLMMCTFRKIWPRSGQNALGSLASCYENEPLRVASMPAPLSCLLRARGGEWLLPGLA